MFPIIFKVLWNSLYLLKYQKNGSEFLVYMDNLDDDEDQSNSSDKSEEEISKAMMMRVHLLIKKWMNALIKKWHRARKKKQKPQSTKIKSLVDISSDPLINKDARFLEQIQSALLKNDTNDVFKAHIKKMFASFFDARKSVKNDLPENW